MSMKQRHELILHEVIRSYLGTGEPVGSRYLAETSDLHLGAASIRNAMSALERLGMLHSPHKSAGRVPTDQGLRYFVDALMVVDEDLQARVAEHVANHLSSQFYDQQAILRKVGDELAELTHYASLVSVPSKSIAKVCKLDLVGLSTEQLLAVIVSDTGEVQNHLLRRPVGLSDQQLDRLAARFTELWSGCDWHTASHRLQQTLQQEHGEIQQLSRQLSHWMGDVQHDQSALLIHGQAQLLNVPDLAMIDTMRSLVAAFEEKQSLLQVIEQLKQEETGVKVFIGREHALVNMEEVSLVLSRYTGTGQSTGVLGVIGPKRMPYNQVLPLVDCTAQLLSRVMGGRSD